jgi:hypothetical protein
MGLVGLLSTLAAAEDPGAGAAAADTHVSFEADVSGLAVSAVRGRDDRRDLCIAPCRIEASPGLQEYFAKGGGHVALGHTFDVRPGENVISVSPGSAALRGLGSGVSWTGVALLAAGVSLVVVDEDELLAPRSAQFGLAGAGALFVGGGLVIQANNKGKWSIAYR